MLVSLWSRGKNGKARKGISRRESKHQHVRSAIRLVVEALEQRQLLSASAVAWTGAASDSDWNNSQNWSTGAVPGSTDDVTIDLPGSATVNLGSGTATIHNLTCTDALSVSSATLMVTGAASISGKLTGSGAALQADGPGASLRATGATTVDSCSLSATNGGSLSLPTVTNYAKPAWLNASWIASGPGSTLSLPGLLGLGTIIDPGQGLWVQASQGGQVNVPLLQTISKMPPQQNSWVNSGSGRAPSV